MASTNERNPDETVLELLGSTRAVPRLESVEDAPQATGLPAGSPSSLPKGTGRYEIDGEIGRGGMGVVLRGRDVDLGRDVAIKTLLHGDADPVTQTRFVEEAQIGGQLQHPGIVPVYDLGLDPAGNPYFAMKLVGGKNLAQLLADRESPDQDRQRFLGIFAQVCQAVAYAHARGVIHRDLKPANVMVGAFGEVMVMDWGLARVLDSQAPSDGAPGEATVATVRSEDGDATQSLEGDVIGTIAYMPPEQARGERDRVDERADVFSLGATLYEILTGHRLYSGVHYAQLLVDAIEGTGAEALSRVSAEHIGTELAGLVRECLEPAPDDRPQDARSVAERMDSYLASVEERAHQARVAAAEEKVRAESERRARRLWVALLSTILVLGAVTVGSVAFVSHQERVAAERIRDQVELALDETTQLRAEAREEADGVDAIRWRLAVQAAERAHNLAVDGDADEDTRRRTKDMLETTRADAQRAGDAAERRRRNRALLASLENTRVERGSFDWDAPEPDFAAAFAAHGLDVQALPLDEAAILLAETGIATELASALDSWAVHRLAAEDEATSSRLLELASLVDDDPDRVQLRATLMQRDLDGLRQRAAELDAASPITWDLVGLALSTFGADDEAGELYLRAVTRHPDDFWLRINYAATMSASLRADLQLEQVTAALALRPDNARLWLGAGFLASRLDRHAEGIAFAEQAIRVQPELAPKAYNNMGIASMRMGNLEAAEENYRNAITAAPDYARAHYNLGRLLERRGEHEDAMEHAHKAIRAAPEYAEGHALLGSLLYRTFAFEDAVAPLREAIRLEPNLTAAHFLLGDTYKLLGKFERSEEHFALAARSPQSSDVDKLSPETLRAAHRLARRRLEQAKRMPAIQAGDDEPRSATDAHALAEVAYGLRLYRTAAELSERGFALSPESRSIPNLYAAACAGVLATTTRSEDSKGLTAEARNALLDRARSRLEEWAASASTNRLKNSLRDRDFATVRDPEHLEQLPPELRTPWQDLWRQVRARANE